MLKYPNVKKLDETRWVRTMSSQLTEDLLLALLKKRVSWRRIAGSHIFPKLLAEVDQLDSVASGWFCIESFGICGEELAGSHVSNMIGLLGWYALQA